MAIAESGRLANEQEMVAKFAKAAASVEAISSELKNRYSERLFHRIEKSIPDSLRRKFDADDIVQEAFHTAFQKIWSFEDRGKGSFYRWLAGIADNTLKATVAKAIRQDGGREALQIKPEEGSEFKSYQPLVEMLAAEGHTPSESVARREAAAMVKEALGALNPPQCAAMILCHLHQWSRQRAAEAMGITKAALGSLLHRGLHNLREALGNQSDFINRK